MHLDPTPETNHSPEPQGDRFMRRAVVQIAGGAAAAAAAVVVVPIADRLAHEEVTGGQVGMAAVLAGLGMSFLIRAFYRPQ